MNYSLQTDSNYTKSIPIKIQPQTIILFDEAGEIITLQNVSGCISKFWCENDGGIQYEPTYILAIDKSKCRRKLQYKNPKILGKISCFAIINYNDYQCKTFNPVNGTEDKNVVMRGRLSADYNGYRYKDSRVYEFYDRNVQITAEKDDSGMTDYCIMLEAFNIRRDFDLGCCGP